MKGMQGNGRKKKSNDYIHSLKVRRTQNQNLLNGKWGWTSWIVVTPHGYVCVWQNDGWGERTHFACIHNGREYFLRKQRRYTRTMAATVARRWIEGFAKAGT